jgi:N-acetyl-anhydromuramyl-L-alanine amidase AmpD
LVIRALPGGVDVSKRLKRGQIATAVGMSFDENWLYITNDELAGWASRQYLEEVSEDEPDSIKPRWIGAHENNFRTGRHNDMKPDMIVIHVIEGTLKSCDNWFNNGDAGVSAHYGIGLRRELHQYVREEDTAYHAGRVQGATAPLVKERNLNPNYYSIGIEHEGTATSEWPDTMYEDSARLVADIAKRHNIPLDRRHVVEHHEIYAPKSCPGRGDVDRIVKMARAL